MYLSYAAPDPGSAAADGYLVLPSASSAFDLVNGVEGAGPRVVAHLLGRAVLIGVGLAAAGAGKNTAKYALAGSAAIEAFVLMYAWHLRQDQCA